MSKGETTSAVIGFVVFTGLSIAAIYTGQLWVLEYTAPLAISSGYLLMGSLFD